METRLNVTVVVDEGTIHGDIRIGVHQWEDGKLVNVCTVIKKKTLVPPIDPEKSVVPWAIAVLRDTCDIAVADLLEKMNLGEGILMRPPLDPQLF